MAKKKSKKKKPAPRRKKATAKPVDKPCKTPAKRQISTKWRRIFTKIPGYDPIKTAGDCWFDEEKADHAVGFFPECLIYTSGEKGGDPFKLEDWQKAIVGCIFGWKRLDGTRRYRTIFIYVPRKNGKSSMTAGIMLYVLYFDEEIGAELYGAASKRDQAGIIFKIAAKMVRANKEMLERVNIYKGMKVIELKTEQAVYRVISADADTEMGGNVHAAVVDELHTLPKRDIPDMLESGRIARLQPLIIYTTTADWARPSICNEKLDYARKVRDGRVENEKFLPVIFEMKKSESWRSKRTWRRVNPNLGISFKMEALEEEYNKAVEIPGTENTFRRMHVNEVTEQAERWLSIEEWDECAGERSSAELAEAMEGKECWGGLDLASKVDIAALVLVFKEEEKFVALPFCWVPKDSAEIREKRQGVPYLTWSRQGLLKATPGNVIDFDVIRDDILELMKKYRIVDIGADPYNAGNFLTLLHEEDGLEVVEFRQGYLSMSDPTKNLGMLVKAGRLIHGGHAVMKWSAANVVVETDSTENVKPSKKKSTEKIDPIVALIMAVGRAMGGETKESVYEQRGVLTV